MADRRTLDSAAKAVLDKLVNARDEQALALDTLTRAKTTLEVIDARVASLSDAYELVKPKVRVRTKAAKVA